MNFGQAIGTACSTFAITNIDDLFVLVTFFAEAATNPATTSLKIIIGQYLGFSIIVLVSMIGYGVATVLPAEPIGFLGLLPIALGVWKGLHLLFPDYKKGEGEVTEVAILAGDETRQGEGRWQRFKKGGLKPMFAVAAVTIMNGGDNKHILRIAERWAEYVVPFLYIGLGIFIIVKSECYSWSIERIDQRNNSHTGKVSMGVSTAVLLFACISFMVWCHWKRSKENRDRVTQDSEQGSANDIRSESNSKAQGQCRANLSAIELDKRLESDTVNYESGGPTHTQVRMNESHNCNAKAHDKSTIKAQNTDMTNQIASTNGEQARRQFST